MAKGSASPAAVRSAALPTRPPHDASTVPVVPPGALDVTVTSLGRHAVLHRVHQGKFRAAQFNPGTVGNARFSPICDQSGKAVPTLYGGTTMDCALMETVFHDVPHTAGFKAVEKRKLEGQTHSTIRTTRKLDLVDLASVPLRKLGVTRKQLIESEKDQYPETRKWAEAIHRRFPKVHGLTWVSRQDDSARAFVFFGDRIASDTIQQTGESRSLTPDTATHVYDEVLALADRIGVTIVP